MNLLAYRLRPLPGAVLIALPAVLLGAAWWLAPRLGGIGAIRFLQFTAVPLGLLAAFTVSRDVDAPEPVLASAPHPYWRTPALRATLWFMTAVTVVGLTGDVIDARVLEPLPVDAAVSLARADLLLIAGLAFVFSIRWESFMGGARRSRLVRGCAETVARLALARPRHGGHASLGTDEGGASVHRGCLLRGGLALPASS